MRDPSLLSLGRARQFLEINSVPYPKPGILAQKVFTS
jgi:hypothetical protein